jgi:hypothetical protein
MIENKQIQIQQISESYIDKLDTIKLIHSIRNNLNINSSLDGILVEPIDKEELFDEGDLPITEVFHHSFDTDEKFESYKLSLAEDEKQLQKDYEGFHSYPFTREIKESDFEATRLQIYTNECCELIKQTAKEHFNILPKSIVEQIKRGAKFELYGVNRAYFDKLADEWVEAVNTKVSEDNSIESLCERFLDLEIDEESPDFGKYSLQLSYGRNLDGINNITINELRREPNNHGHLSYISLCKSNPNKTILYFTTQDAGEELGEAIVNAVASYALIIENPKPNDKPRKKATLIKMFSNYNQLTTDDSFDTEIERMMTFDSSGIYDALKNKDSKYIKILNRSKDSVRILQK